MTVVPYKAQTADKKTQVAQMFDNIAHRYDFLNHFLSFGIDIYWRKRAIRLLRAESNPAPRRILDVATGTGDFALEALALKPDKIIGVDISEGMLARGREKIRRKGHEQVIELRTGDSERLLFEDNYFDAVIVSFGVRNFADLAAGLRDMGRVLRPGGTCVVLEFSRPKSFPFKQLCDLYYRYLLPAVGRLVSKDAAAYRYLPESVAAFPDGEDFLHLFRQAGFNATRCIPLTFGICSLYVGKK